MKKTILLLALMLTFNQVHAKDIKYINCLPYREYKKEIKLKNITSEALEVAQGIIITKNKYQFDYIFKKMGIPHEYIITNNSGNDLMLTGIYGAEKYFNRDLNRKHSKRVKPMINACLTTWYFYIPYADIIMGGISDVEKNKFTSDFPKSKVIKTGESLRILCIEMKKGSSLQFVFENGILEF